MAQKLNVNNFGKLNLKEHSEINADAAVAATNLTLASTKDYSANDFLIIGSIGSDTSELATVASVTNDTALVISAGLKFAHERYDTVTSLFGNKIRIYRAANDDGSAPADGSFAQIAEVDIDVDQKETVYEDGAGGAEFWYKITYYNSVSTSETALTDSQAVRGGGYGNYASLESIRAQAGLQGNRHITEATIDQKRQAVQSLINSTLTGRYVVPFSSPINPLISEITRVLAAGYLLTQEFGSTSASTYREGEEMIARVTNEKGTGLLDRLNIGTLTLSDAQGVTQESSGGSNYSGWPNRDTATAEPSAGGGERKFRVSDRY